MSFKDVGLTAAILKTLRDMCAAHNILPKIDDLKDLFTQLLTKIAAKEGKIVLLIDEYDKPIIQYMEAHKMPQAIENQDIMRDFYGPLKDKGDCLFLTFITGVSKFILLMGINIESEVHTKRGRLDAVIQTNTHLYIFEFKFNKTSAATMEQLKKRDYAAKFRNIPIHSPSDLGVKTIIGIGLNLTEKDRKLDEWIVEEL